jgi:hypothetical protein
LHAIDDNLLVNTLAKILKLTLSMQMGLYCWILLALFFWKKSYIPKLRLKSGRLPAWKSLNKAIRSFLVRLQKT